MDIIKTYNPTNTNITKEELSAMKDLTDEQIAELAKAYPNQPRGNAYLEYWMTNEKEVEQRYPLGTWANLHNLRKLGRKDILPFGFRRANQPRRIVTVDTPSQRVVDLSEQDLKDAEGLKQHDEKSVIPMSPASPDLARAERELQEAIGAKAHPNTIKAIQERIEMLKGVVAEAQNRQETQEVAQGRLEPAIVSPELEAAQKELQQAIDDKAHHMTIKKLQATVDALK